MNKSLFLKPNVETGIFLFQALLTFIFLHAGLEKVLGGTVPEWFLQQFAPTFLAHLPGGVAPAYWGIATLEVLAGIVGAIALIRPRLADTAFVSAEVVFFALGVGLRISHKYTDAATLFAYFALTLLVHLATSLGGNFPGRRR